MPARGNLESAGVPAPSLVARPGRPTDREIVISRVFDAPRELVWEVWTDPRHIVHWWGPNGFTTTIETMDVGPGGVGTYVMHSPDGAEGDKTRATLRLVFASAGEREHVAREFGAIEGGHQTLGRLATYLAQAA